MWISFQLYIAIVYESVMHRDIKNPMAIDSSSQETRKEQKICEYQVIVVAMKSSLTSDRGHLWESDEAQAKPNY